MKIRCNNLVGFNSLKEWEAIGASEHEMAVRRTGRSTSQAFNYIGEALAHPGQAVRIRDHHDNRMTDRILFERVARIVSETGLRCVVMSYAALTITFNLWGEELK